MLPYSESIQITVKLRPEAHNDGRHEKKDHLLSEVTGTGFSLVVQKSFTLLSASIIVVFSLFTFVVPTLASAMSKSLTPTAARLSKETTTFGIMITFPAQLATHS